MNDAATGPPTAQTERDVVFLSKGTPDDDDFALWLAPRLEAAGYRVFADVICLKFGDQWRKVLTDTLYDRACKMLLCCRTSTLAKEGVLEEIDIAKKLSRELSDNRFIVPLRLEKNFRAPFGTSGLQFADFEKDWSQGLSDLLEYLKEEGVPESSNGEVNQEWQNYRTRRSLQVQEAPEALVSNWLRISSLPDRIHYYVPKGSISIGAVTSTCKALDFPAHYHNRGVLTFMKLHEIDEAFEGIAAFELKAETDALSFNSEGLPSIELASKDARNILMSMLREAWNAHCRKQNLLEYAYSKQVGFHASEAQVPLNKRVSWGRQGDRRSAVLRNIARGKVWNFGITGQPSFWPFPHFKMKTRVLFANVTEDRTAGSTIESVDQQFRLRRSICSGWRNKQWYGRLMAFLEILSGDSAYITVPLSPSESLKLVAEPMTFTSPVTTLLPDDLDDDAEELDETVLAGFASNDDEGEEQSNGTS